MTSACDILFTVPSVPRWEHQPFHRRYPSEIKGTWIVILMLTYGGENPLVSPVVPPDTHDSLSLHFRGWPFRWFQTRERPEAFSIHKTNRHRPDWRSGPSLLTQVGLEVLMNESAWTNCQTLEFVESMKRGRLLSCDRLKSAQYLVGPSEGHGVEQQC